MISIIIPTYNRCKFLIKALSSVLGQDFPTNNYEILIIDNASNDETKTVAKSAIYENPSHRVRYFFEAEPGLLSGRHRGALEADGDVLTFIDDDIEATPHWLKAIEESFTEPLVQLVGGRNLPDYEVPPPDWLTWFWRVYPNGKACEYLSLLDFGNYIHEIDANYVWGLNFSIRKQALSALGGFHPDSLPTHLQHFQGDGETGLTRKAKAHGYKTIYHPAACIFHQVPKHRMTYEYFERRSFYQGVCDSYADIRANQGISPFLSKNVLGYIKKLAKKIIVRPTSKELLQSRFDFFYQKGYQFHQQAVRRHSELLTWVLKDTYWDYTLPRLSNRHHILGK